MGERLPQGVLEGEAGPQRGLDGGTAGPHDRADQGRDLLAEPGHGVFDLVDQQWLKAAVEEPSAAMPIDVRLGLELALDLAVWIDDYAPEIRIG
ncbi:hypothetical protein [Glycomyces sp. NPDC021274]|uniref:hypothetical protein n=1 Tax=Glycomyces sp. NPDC021274 TaxID=3155120 RepID=UPI003403F29A